MASRASSPPLTALSLGTLLEDFSLEMTAKDIEQIAETAAVLPQGTAVSVTFLPGESFASRIDAAVEVHRMGLRPVPHISARRLTSEGDLEGFLERLAEMVELRHVFVVAGDLPQPSGPYDDALAVIRSGLLQKYGVRHVGIAGYPEGHPDIAPDMLWAALADKAACLRGEGLECSIMTQFGFDAAPVLRWLAEVRARGIDAPVRLGVAGPSSIKTLLRFAARCGVEASASVLKKYGLSLTRLMGTATPEPMLEDLAAGLDPQVHGEARIHFYPFGGLARTARWVDEFTCSRAGAYNGPGSKP